MRLRGIFALLVMAGITVLPCRGKDIPQTARTKDLARELLRKLDSTDVYVARKENLIASAKAGLDYYSIARLYSNYVIDSTLVYLDKATEYARSTGNDSLRIKTGIFRANVLSDAGFYLESYQLLQAIPQKVIPESLLVSYYNAWANLYHGLYTGPNEPADFQSMYWQLYDTYRDSLLAVADTSGLLYLRSMEKKEGRAGNTAEARRYNALRMSRIPDHHSAEYATCLYDRYSISNLYEQHLTGEAVDDLLESAIIEVELCNRNIASLLRVETLAININEIRAAKKISDYYYSSLLKLGSKKRLIDGSEQTIKINERILQLIVKKNRQFWIALIVISLMLLAMIPAMVIINRTRVKITRLKNDLEQSGKISKGYIGVVFQLYSSYIIRLGNFRTRIHAYLKKGQVEQALEITSPSGEIDAEERRELFHNFDTAFVDIFPTFISTVNSCLRADAQIIPKRTEILNTELRILALIKLGIEDSTKIAEMLHCSVKTVYNLRSGLKARLTIPEEDFKRIIAEL